MEVNRNLSVMKPLPTKQSLQSAMIEFARACTFDTDVRGDKLAMASLRITFELLAIATKENRKINSDQMIDDVRFLHERIVELNIFPSSAVINQVADVGENQICENLIAKIAKLIDSAPENEIIPHLERLERIATQPQYIARLNFYKRALGLPITSNGDENDNRN